MSGSRLIQLSLKAATGLGAMFLVGVLLAAIPNHHAPTVRIATPEPGQEPRTGASSSMPATDMEGEQTNEEAAVHDMALMHHGDTAHMHMTSPRPETAEDQKRAQEIVAQLKPAIEKYRDYHVALDEGFRIFRPDVPQKEYHFTNYTNGFFEAFTFDPARPTSLLYKKTATGYELVGAMYTMPKRVTEDQLNERVPLSVAQWHLHVNLCMPPKEQRGHADLTKFGLQGSILTKEVCTEAGGTFYPVIFGWMVHVYPFEDSREKIWGQ